MAFVRFIPEDGIQGNISESERDYIDSLIAHANRLGRSPVLSCTRSLGRLPAIKSAFPGFHILIYRNLFRQWCSYTEQYARGNPYFFDTVKLCIEHGSHDRFLGYLNEALPLGDRGIDSSNYFCAFVLLHIYLYAHAADAADMIFDVESAVCDEKYRKLAEHEIMLKSGLTVSLSDIKGSIGFSFLDGISGAELKERIRVMSDVAVSLAPSEAGRQFAVKALAGFMEEWEKYDFYAGTLSAFAGPRGLLGKRDALAAERDALLASRNTLAGERDALAAERDALLASRNTLAGGREALAAERDALLACRNTLAGERDALAAERDALLASRNTLAGEHEALAAERDALLASRNIPSGRARCAGR
jgi:hypothetical protein